MRAVIQRVEEASVSVSGKVVGSCGHGFLILLCVMESDTENDIPVLVKKIVNLRIFSDENGKINKSLLDTGGQILLISQFTLAADCRHGNRPDFLSAAPAEKAKAYFEIFEAEIKKIVPETETGVFGEHMHVSLVNDGPFTVILDTDNLKKRA